MVGAGVSGEVAEAQFVPDRILVKPKAGILETNLIRKFRIHGATGRQTLHRSNIRIVGVSEENVEAVLAALRNDPDVEFAERDPVARAAFLPNDPSLVSGNEWHLSRIQTPQAWNLTTGITSAIVAVLDSGVDAAHPDLAGHVLPGYDFVNNDSDPMDDFGHGTAVSGTIVAAGNNAIGVAGVAFGARVLPVKVMDASGFASYSCLAQGIEYALDHGARVINISVAGDAPSSTLQNAINDAWSNNVIVVAAAGNNGNSAPQYPAACDHVVGVAATEPDDTLAWFSSYGSNVTLSAPGDNIWTTQNHVDKPYGAWRGTSFASPIVAGVAALVASENPTLSNTRIVSILEQTADDAGSPGWDTSFGYGRVNAYGAVSEASFDPGALPPSAPPDSGTTNVPAVFGSDTHLLPDSSGLMTPLVVQVRGSGTVAPNLDGRLLETGRLYTIKAVPGRGQVFAGWNGAQLRSPRLSFRMQSNLTLVADFVPSPFPQVRGSYAGLMANTNGVLPENSGCFRLTVTSAGRFTGKLWVGGRGFGLHGMLDLQGDATVGVNRGRIGLLTIGLHLDLTNGSDQVIGQVTDGDWVSELTGDRNVFNARSNPAPQAGLHAFILQQSDDPVLPAAAGLSAIANGGTARVRGHLRGKRAFGAASLLAKNGDCPFYLSLNHGSEVVIGRLSFPAETASAASGTVLWVRTGPNAFAATLRAASER